MKPPDVPAGARTLVRSDGSVIVPPHVASELLRMLVRDLDAQARSNGGQPSPAARRLLWALHEAAVRDDQADPGFADETRPAAAATVEMSTAEVAAALECSLQYARRLARTGRVRARRTGRVWLVDPTSLDAYRRGERPCPHDSMTSAPLATTS